MSNIGSSAKSLLFKRRSQADAALQRTEKSIDTAGSVASSVSTVTFQSDGGSSLLTATAFTTVDEPDTRENVKVCVRIRPLVRTEEAKNETLAFSWENHSISQLSIDSKNGYRNTDASGQPLPSYIFDHLFYPEHTNEDIYELVVHNVVSQAMKGFHGSVFAYGQTSSGKTFTMHGTRKFPGIIPMAIHECFDSIHLYPDREFLFRVSYLEVYNEAVHDLLNSEPTSIKIQFDPKIGTVLSGVKEMVVVTAQQVIAVIESGEAQRHVGSTDMNEKSSRSHSLFKLIIESHERAGGNSAPVRCSTLNLVDLAGSENAKMTNAKGARALEAKFINQSLLTLSTIIQRLSEEKAGGFNRRQHLPYRDSKLTRIMQSALSGNANIAIVCTISPALSCVDESNNTMKFAARAKKIKTESKVNEVMDDKTLLRQYREEIDLLRAKVSQMETMMRSAPATGGSREDEDDTRDVDILAMIDHMERLILKSEATVSGAPATPSDAVPNVSDETSYFVRKPHKRRSTVAAVVGANQGSPEQSVPSGTLSADLLKQRRGHTANRKPALSLTPSRSECFNDDATVVSEAANWRTVESRGEDEDSTYFSSPAISPRRLPELTSPAGSETAVLTNVTSILRTLREQIAQSKARPTKRPDPNSQTSAEEEFAPARPITVARDKEREESQQVADLMLQLRLMEADNRFLQDAVERKEVVMERLTEGLKDVQVVQDELVSTNESLAAELDDTRRALEETSRRLWELTQERDGLLAELRGRG